MQRQHQGRWVMRGLLAAGLLTIAACGSDDNASSTSKPAATSASTAASGSAVTTPASTPDATDTTQTSDTTAASSASSDTTADTEAAGDVAIDRSQVIKIGLLMTPNGPASLDPAVSVVNADQNRWYTALYDTLVHYDETGLVPGLAESWEFPDDYTVIFHLRHGVTFHDGTPFNAEAVKFSWERALRLSKIAAGGETAVDTVEATDEYTVTAKLKNPVVGDFVRVWMLQPTFLSIVSPTAVEKYGDAGFAEHPVGAGPYKFDSWQKDQSIKLVPYENYWDPSLQHFAGWEVYNVPTGQGRLSALRSGQVNITQISAADVEAAEAAGFEVTVGAQHSFTRAQLMTLSPCGNRAPFDSVESRQALAYAVDRDAINQGAFNGKTTTAIGLLQPGDKYYDASTDPDYTYDKDKAAQMLRDAGVAEGTHVKLMVNNNTTEASLIGQIVQQQLQDVGLDVELIDSPTFITDLPTVQPDLIITRLPLVSLPAYFYPQGAGGFINPCNNGSDELRAAIATSKGSDESLVPAAWKTITKENAEQAWFIPLVNSPTWYAHTPGLHILALPTPEASYFEKK